MLLLVPLSALGFAVLAALYQYADVSWSAVFFSCLTGGAFSALFSLIVTRMQFVHQMLSETLHEVKDINPLTTELGKKVTIRKELLTDLGVDHNSAIIAKIFVPVIDACNKKEAPGEAADHLYGALQSSAFAAAVQSLFLPKYPHVTRAQSSLR